MRAQAINKQISNYTFLKVLRKKQIRFLEKEKRDKKYFLKIEIKSSWTLEKAARGGILGKVTFRLSSTGWGGGRSSRESGRKGSRQREQHV